MAGSAIENTLVAEYANQPVLFVEYDVDTTAYNNRWGSWRWYDAWQAAGGSGIINNPQVMTDSGNAISYGPEEYATKYRTMVNASLLRPAKATLTASSQRVGDMLRFNVQLTNQSGVTLGTGNSATVWAIAYEVFATAPGTGRLTKRVARAVVSQAITSNLANGATTSLTLDTPTLSGVVWENLQWIVLTDYRPGGSSGAYDTLQAISSLSAQSNSSLLWTK